MVKNLPAMQKTRVWSLGWEDPLEKGMTSHSSICVWRIPWTESTAGYSPWVCQELDTTEQLTLCFHFSISQGLVCLQKWGGQCLSRWMPFIPPLPNLDIQSPQTSSTSIMWEFIKSVASPVPLRCTESEPAFCKQICMTIIGWGSLLYETLCTRHLIPSLEERH